MARGKKKEELTLEEKLEQALVPVEEQPYEVPGNWCWVRIKEICEFERGITFPASAKENEETEDNIACLRTANIQDELEIDDLIYVNKEFMKNNDLKLVRKDDIIMSSANSRELVGKVSYVRDLVKPMTFGGFVLNIRAKKVLSKYLFYLLKFQFLTGKFRGESTQTTNIANINTKTLGNHCFPLPPLEEQKRIVERIENLFAKLDEAKEKVQEVLDTFEDRKSSIFYKAFQGVLTEKWRTKKDINILDWKKKTVKDVCDDIKVGIVIKPTQYYTEPDSGVAAFRSANVREGYIEDENWVYINQIGQQENKRSEVHTGDVLVVRSGNPGTACVVTEEYDGFNAIDIIIAVPDLSQIDSQYLCHYTNSPESRRLVQENKRGMALSHFNVSGYSKLPIRVPSMEEQKEIVRVLDDNLSRETVAYESAKYVVVQIDRMKKSILVKAFRGELGTNNFEEDSSMELLKKILTNI